MTITILPARLRLLHFPKSCLPHATHAIIKACFFDPRSIPLIFRHPLLLKLDVFGSLIVQMSIFAQHFPTAAPTSSATPKTPSRCPSSQRSTSLRMSSCHHSKLPAPRSNSARIYFGRFRLTTTQVKVCRCASETFGNHSTLPVGFAKQTMQS